MKAPAIRSALLGIAALAAAPLALAQDAPRGWEASPDIYKVVAENATHRIVEVTWKPGQRDNFHSHAGNMGVYYTNDCKLRGHMPDGKTREGDRKGGQARFSNPIKSHSVENIGATVCRVLLFEPK